MRDDSDTATYEIRQLDEDPGALPFEVSAALRAKIFALAGELHNFQGQDLDVHRKIANLGEKTFRWQQGSISAAEPSTIRQSCRRYVAAAPCCQIGEDAAAAGGEGAPGG